MRVKFSLLGVAFSAIVSIIPSVYGGLVTNSNTDLATAYNNGKKIVKSGSTLYAVSVTDGSPPPLDFSLFLSIDNGSTWTLDTEFDDQLGFVSDPHDPSIAVDENSFLLHPDRFDHLADSWG